MTEQFKSPCLPESRQEDHVDSKNVNIGLVTSQIEGPVENIDDVETTEVEAEKMLKISIQAPVLNYEPPSWACQPDENDKFQFEIMKEGKIIGYYDLKNRKNESFVIIGRIKPGCDLVMEHPSISRYHCILQYGDDKMSKTGKGWHIYEMGSTHGTKMNKNRLPPKQYIRVRVGFIFQFGESSRIYNLLGPEQDCEPEWDCSPTEMKLKHHKKVLEAKLKSAAAASATEMEMNEKEKVQDSNYEDEGCSWGMSYDDEESKALPINESDAHLMDDREAYYNQDPKKALAKFFEREGFEMKFEFSEQGQGHTHKWVCAIELPVEIEGVDRAFTASATVSTSKKDAQAQCALEACRILDTYNVLRKSNTKMRMKRKTLESNDYYEEDDDLYLDRTGQLEAQREKRKKWAEEGYGGRRGKNETYETLCAKLEAAKNEIIECEKQLEKLGSSGKPTEKVSTGDSLDDYIREIQKSGTGGDDAKTKTEKSKWRQKLVAATHERQKLEKLVKIAEPIKCSDSQTMSATSGNRQAYLRKLIAAKKAEKNQTSNVEEQNPPKISKIEEAEISSQLEEKVEKKDEKMVENNEDEKKEEKSSELQKRVAEWEKELETEQKLAKERRQKMNKAPPRNIENETKSIGNAADYGAGCENRNEKYTTWMPNEDSESKQEALRAKFAGKY